MVEGIYYNVSSNLISGTTRLLWDTHVVADISKSVLEV
jgi:hypothetical protein